MVADAVPLALLALVFDALLGEPKGCTAIPTSDYGRTTGGLVKPASTA